MKSVLSFVGNESNSYLWYLFPVWYLRIMQIQADFDHIFTFAKRQSICGNWLLQIQGVKYLIFLCLKDFLYYYSIY